MCKNDRNTEFQKGPKREDGREYAARPLLTTGSLLNVLEQSNEMIWIVDRSYRLAFSNRICREALELSGFGTIRPGESVFKENSPELLVKAWKNKYDRCFRGDYFLEEMSYPFPIGTRYFELSFAPFLDETGTLTGAFVIGHDVTESRVAMDELKEVQKVFRYLNELSSDYIFKLIPTGNGSYKMVVVAGNYTLATGRIFEEVNITALWEKIIHPDDIDLLKNRLSEVPLKEGPVVFECRSFDVHGNIRWLEVVGSPDIDPQTEEVLAIYGSVKNISDRKNTEIALRQSEEQFRSLFETMAQGVVYQDVSGKITFANPAAERILGLTLEQMTGRTSTDPLWHAIHEDGTPFPGDRHPAMLALTTGLENSAVMGVFNVAREKYTWILVNAIPQFRENTAAPYQVYATFEDITPLRESLIELDKTRKRLEALRKIDYEISRTDWNESAVNEIAMRTIGELIPSHAILLVSLDWESKEVISEATMAGGSFMGKTGKKVSFFPFEKEILSITSSSARILNPDQILFDYNISPIFEGFKEVLSVPFLYQGRVGGFLLMIARESGGFTEEHRQIAEEIANQLSFNFQKLELHNKVRKYARTLELLVEEKVRELSHLSTLHQGILDNAGLAIIATDENGIIRLFNKAAEDMLGYKAGEVIGSMTVDKLQDPEEIAKIISLLPSSPDDQLPPIGMLIKYYLLLGTNYNEWTCLRKDGSRFPAKITVTPLLDPVGNVKGFIGIASDISNEKSVLEALKESEERFHKMFTNHSAIMLLIDPVIGRIMDANKAAESFYGYRFRQKSTYTIFDINILPKEEVEDILRMALIRKKKFHEFRHRLSSGEIRDVDAHTTPIEVRGKKMIFVVIHDVTQRKVAEAALKMQSAAFESVTLAIIITDTDGMIQWANTAFTNLTGYPTEEYIGKNPRELLRSGREDPAVYSELWKTILAGKVWSGELINRRKDGSHYHEEQIITPVLGHDGTIRNFIALKIDITKRKEIEQSLIKTIEKEKQLNQMKTKFISVASHEFRTPLATILSNSELLYFYRDKMTREEQEVKLIKINAQVKHLNQIIEELLQLSRLQSKGWVIEPQWFDLIRFCQQICEEYNLPGEPARLSFEPGISALKVFHDRKLIRHVLSNILSNSLKYSRPDIPVSMGINAGDEVISMVVKDHGNGIPEDEIRHIFDPFFRGSNVSNIPGTGLGLNIVQEILSILGGEIRIVSELNRGTEVTVSFPLKIENHEANRNKEKHVEP